MARSDIDKALGLVENERWKRDTYRLKELAKPIKEYGVEQNVKFDLTLVSHMSYYTGILFEVYAGRLVLQLATVDAMVLLEKFG